jgi:hypothetical protein
MRAFIQCLLTFPSLKSGLEERAPLIRDYHRADCNTHTHTHTHTHTKSQKKKSQLLNAPQHKNQINPKKISDSVKGMKRKVTESENIFVNHM